MLPIRTMLLGMTLLLTACPAPQAPSEHTPGATTQPTPTPQPTPTAEPTAEPTPTPSASPVDLQGRLYDLSTGKPLIGATALIGGMQVVTGSDGSFKVALESENTATWSTFLAAGYVPLSISGYAGGPLYLQPDDAVALDITSTVVSLQTPPGSATSSVLAIAVKPTGHAYASSVHLYKPTFSAQGTASVKVTPMPRGEATLLAYGTDGTVAGGLRTPVSSAISLSLAPVPRYDLYQASVATPRTDGSTTQIASFDLVWPSETPDLPNRLWLGVISGASTAFPIALPPASAFGIPEASYAVSGRVLDTATYQYLAERYLQPLTPGARSVPMLAEPGAEATSGAFGVLPSTSPGATAYYADVQDPDTERFVWRLVSLGETPKNLTLPALPASLQSWRLPTGKSYLVRVGAAEGLRGFKATGAYTQGKSLNVPLPSAE